MWEQTVGMPKQQKYVPSEWEDVDLFCNRGGRRCSIYVWNQACVPKRIIVCLCHVVGLEVSLALATTMLR
jgi:hypothetical protein